jgi:hypothetical protein
MSNDDLLKAFKKWKDKAGRSRALSCLTARSLSPRTAEYLVTDAYTMQPKAKLRAALMDILKVEKL